MKTWTVVLCLGCLALGCTEPSRPAGRLGGGAESAPPVVVDDDRRTGPGPLRVIRPMDGSEDCLEMVSVCRPGAGGDPECTSSPVVLACGEETTIPSGERLRCACGE